MDAIEATEVFLSMTVTVAIWAITLFLSDWFKLKNFPGEFSIGNINLGPVLSKKTKIIINELWTFEINVTI